MTVRNIVSAGSYKFRRQIALAGLEYKASWVALKAQSRVGFLSITRTSWSFESSQILHRNKWISCSMLAEGAGQGLLQKTNATNASGNIILGDIGVYTQQEACHNLLSMVHLLNLVRLGNSGYHRNKKASNYVKYLQYKLLAFGPPLRPLGLDSLT
ncbi:hypothetical protein Lal_00007321 [Lupinus albus]|nr:hypothetical protein Lal_00007321 [Lupinus albus]